MRRVLRASSLLVLLLLLLLLVIGCDRNDMHDGARVRPNEESPVFADGTVSRPLVAGTVPREPMHETGVPHPAASGYPERITLSYLKRGQQRYDIYCSVCHGSTGEGDGMIVKRGFVPPPSFHIQRLRDLPDKHFYDAITNGYGAMYSYEDRVAPADRWAIVAYVRALQLSRRTPVAMLSRQDLAQLAAPTTAPTTVPAQTTNGSNAH